MTSVICWINKEGKDAIWVVSDSRVSDSRGGVIIDNCQKLFSITAKYHCEGEGYGIRRKDAFTFGLSYSGSTLIGMNVKEMLEALLTDLKLIPYSDAPNYSFENRLPALEEIADIVKFIATVYIKEIGQNFPNSARCEFLIFGLCPKENKYKAITVGNGPESPMDMIVRACIFNGDEFVIIGNNKALIGQRICDARKEFKEGSINWWRAPFIVLANVLRGEGVGSIGGFLQLCISGSDGVHRLFVSKQGGLDLKLVGLDLLGSTFTVGGFSLGPSFGITLPSENGW
jgi:hypothetical protein